MACFAIQKNVDLSINKKNKTMKRKLYCFLLFGFIGGFFSFLNAQNRDVVSLDGKWGLVIDKENEGLKAGWGEKGLPDLEKKYVNVPFSFNLCEGYDLYWGAAWYERTFFLPKNYENKLIHLRFEAVNHTAIIFVNGKKTGMHSGSPYTPFTVDITPFVKTGSNSIVVYTNNEASANSIPYKKSFDWSHDGGIIRSVNLIKTEHQAMRNIHVKAIPNGTSGNATVKIPFMDFSKIDVKKTKFYATITEENQKTANVVFKGFLKGKIVDNAFVAEVNLKNINLWHFDNPNLYKINVELYEDKTVKDELSAIFGFRTIKIENNRYVLNGEPMRLIGMEWTAGEDLEHGLARTKDNIEKGFALMKNANCVLARCHWQQDQYFLDLCDRCGILVMEEVPLWGWQTRLNDTLLQVAFQHLDEMVDAHYNHPSVIIWGLGNELLSHEEINIKGLDAMEKHVKNLDDSRLVAYISNAASWEVPGPNNILPDASPRYDMIMWNEYNTTWYGYNLDSIAVALDIIHRLYPDKAVTIAEWGICEPMFKGGDELRAKEMVEQVKIYSSKDFVAGAIYFCLNDYRTFFGEDSSYRYPQRIHGICDINLNKKKSYYVFAELSSPIEVKDINVNGNKICLTLFGKTGVPSYILRDYYIIVGDKKIELPIIKPNDIVDVNFETNADEAVIYRSTGFEVLRVKLK